MICIPSTENVHLNRRLSNILNLCTRQNSCSEKQLKKL